MSVVELTFWEGRVLQLYQGIYGARFSFNKGRPLYCLSVFQLHFVHLSAKSSKVWHVIH